METLKAADLFEIPAGITYLNCSNISPQLKSVTAAGLEAVRIKATPWTLTGANWFSSAEELRTLAGKVLGTGADSVALIPAVSYGMAIAAANVPVRAGSSIVLLAEDFPSNVFTWREAARRNKAEVVTVDRDPEAGWTEAILRAITDRTAVVVTPLCHWVDGTVVDLVRVGRACTRRWAPRSSSTPARRSAPPPSTSAASSPTFSSPLATSGSSAPMGSAISTHRRNGNRRASRSNSHGCRVAAAPTSLASPTTLTPFSPARAASIWVSSRSSSPPPCARPHSSRSSTGASLPSSDPSRNSPMTSPTARSLPAIWLRRAEQRAKHMLGIRFRGGLPGKLPAALAQANVYVSIRGDSVRVSPYLYNTSADIDRLFAAIASAI